jgi:plasmid stability protein
MHSIAIRQIDDQLKDRLRQEAARQGCSMEEQARRILRAGLTPPPQKPRGAARHVHLAERIHARFAAAGGVDMPVVPRTAPRPPPKF